MIDNPDKAWLEEQNEANKIIQEMLLTRVADLTKENKELRDKVKRLEDESLTWKTDRKTG